MATAASTRRRAGSPKAAGSGLPKLPSLDVARAEEAGRLIERLVDENTDLFISKGQAFKARHRNTSKRPLTPSEAAQVAAVLVEDARPVEERMAALQNTEGLSAYDEPDAREVLLAAGAATAPAFIATMRQLVALIEMPTSEFWGALDDDELDEVLERRATALRKVPLEQARARASRALAHFAASAGVEAGKAMGLVSKIVGQSLTQALSQLLAEASQSASLMRSPAPTAGTDETS